MKYDVIKLSKEIDVTTPFNKPIYDKVDVFTDHPACKPAATATTFHNVGEGKRWLSVEVLREKLALDKELKRLSQTANTLG
jgi:hypothetical protein